MAVLVASETIAANGNGTAFTPSAGMFMVSVTVGEAVVCGRQASTGTYLPVFVDASRANPGLGVGLWAVYTCAGMQFRVTAGPTGATVEINQ